MGASKESMGASTESMGASTEAMGASKVNGTKTSVMGSGS